MPLGMGHQAEHAAGGVANARHVALGPVGIFGIRDRCLCDQEPSRRMCGRITQHKLAGLVEFVEHFRRAGGETAFAVGDRQVHRVDAGEEHALRCLRSSSPPSGLRTCPERFQVSVAGGPCRRSSSSSRARFDQHLKAVADAENQFARGFESRSASAR